MDTDKRRYNLEIPIVIIIAGLLMILINFSDKKLNELIVSDAEVLFMDMDHDPDDQMHADFAEKISEFRPDVYKMIEVYDDQLNEVVNIQFSDDPVDDNSLRDYPQLMELLLSNTDGHTKIEVGDSVEYIYFKWSYDENEKPYLFIIYTYKPIVKYLWVFHLICYMILLMICVLFIRLLMKSHMERIRLYNELTKIS